MFKHDATSVVRNRSTGRKMLLEPYYKTIEGHRSKYTAEEKTQGFSYNSIL